MFCGCYYQYRLMELKAASTSCLKSSHKHRSRTPATDTRQKLPNSVLECTGPVLPLTTTDMFSCYAETAGILRELTSFD
ncbi:unnamed protein product [Macrosiphum euphorbiae]|uniref:Uncharacterized protein n=1 Tax=Macrosiphum euphorbiae TaxID=13131 RepID=A0AAV0VMJ0_9HEMI|nr:unnamed protein product [Macrosiphum euphorbiae]